MEVNKIILYFGWIEKRVSDLTTKFSKYWEGKVLFKVKNKESTTVFHVTKILLSFIFSIKKLFANQLVDVKYKLATGLIKVYILSNYNINFEVNLRIGWFFFINSRL